MTEKALFIEKIALALDALPPLRRAKIVSTLGHDLTQQTYVWVDSPDGSHLTGLVVAGYREEDGCWDLDSDFTIFTESSERFVVAGCACEVTVWTDELSETQVEECIDA